jgi:hypothetical protein
MANVGVLATYPLFHGFYPWGEPLDGGTLYTYKAGTSTPQAAYHDAAATQPHQNPITLDARGEALLYITEPMLWRLEDPTGVQLWSVDNIGGRGETIPPATVGVDHPDVSIGLVG